MKEEKYIKDTLTNYDSPMDMDAMWAGLEKSLDNNKDEKPVFWLFQYGKKLFFIGFILLLSIAAFTYLSTNKPAGKLISENSELTNASNLKNTQNENQNSEKAVLQSSIETKENTELNAENSKEQQNKELELKSDAHSLSSSKAQAVSKSEAKLNAQQSDRFSESQLNNARKNPSSIYKSTSGNLNTKTSPTTSQSQINTTVQKTQTKPAAPIVKEKTGVPSGEQTTIAQSKILLNRLASLRVVNFINHKRTVPVLQDKIVLPVPTKVRVKEQPKKWRVNINIAQSKSKPTHNNRESQQIFVDSTFTTYSKTNNLGFGIGLARKTQNGLLFSAALNYINHGVLYFGYEEKGIEEEGFKVTVYTDPNNNFLGASEQEAIITTRRIRTFRQYKKLHSLQLPLTVGYEIGVNRFDASVSLGPAVNYFFAQSNNEVETNLGEIKKIEETSVALAYNLSTMKLSGKIRAEVGYLFGESTRLFAAIEGGKLFGKLSGIENFTQTSFNYSSLRAGVSYCF